MASNTFTLIASYTVGSGGVSSIDFTSIPSTYTDLMLVTSLRSEGTSTVAAFMNFNGATTSQANRELYGNGSTVSSSTSTRQYAGFTDTSNRTANTFSNNTVYIPNYAGSTYKSSSADTVEENNGTSANAALWAQLWSNTAAINQITLTPNGSNNFAQYSTAYLYGIKSS